MRQNSMVVVILHTSPFPIFLLLPSLFLSTPPHTVHYCVFFFSLFDILHLIETLRLKETGCCPPDRKYMDHLGALIAKPSELRQLDQWTHRQ